MNVKRFTARTAREALAQVREALGEDAVVLSTKPTGDGVEVLAMAPEGMARIHQAAAQLPVQRAAPPLLSDAEPALRQAAKPRVSTLAERIAARGERLDPRLDHRVEPRLDPPMTGALAFDASHSAALPGGSLDHSVERDVETLGMSTLTFQDYVRERMLKRRHAELAQPSQSVIDALRPPPAARAAAGAAVPLVNSPLATPSLRMVGHDARHDERRAAPVRALPEAPPLTCRAARAHRQPAAARAARAARRAAIHRPRSARSAG